MVDVHLFAVPSDANRSDIRLRANAPGTAFPTQFDGLYAYDAATIKLCLVATADAPTGMGGQLRIRKNATTYAVYLVETTDPNASLFRIRTTTGTKAIRLYT